MTYPTNNISFLVYCVLVVGGKTQSLTGFLKALIDCPLKKFFFIWGFLEVNGKSSSILNQS